MTRKFVHLPTFDAKWSKLELSDEDLNGLQYELCTTPDAGDLMQGTGGLRKYRIATSDFRGKSSGARACYFDDTSKKTIYLILVYSKNEKDNLSMEERKVIKKLIKQLKEL